MARLQTRLRRVEKAVPERRERSEIAELAQYLVGYELIRLLGILERAGTHGGRAPGREQDEADFCRLVALAEERKGAGWQLDRPDLRREELGRINWSKRWAVWQLISSLRNRHPNRFFSDLSNEDYCDLLGRRRQ